MMVSQNQGKVLGGGLSAVCPLGEGAGCWSVPYSLRPQ